MRRIIKSKNLCWLFLILLFGSLSCQNNLKSDLKNGDLLFVTAKDSGLSGAINNVTQKNKTEAFDHIGILKREGTKLFVLHAAPKGGSQKQDFVSFVEDQKKDGQNIVVYRLKDDYQFAIPKALKRAEEMLGKPYNFNYILDEQSYYCSDFVERSFREFSIFKLEPMTFKDPKTGVINDFWKKFYEEKNLKVPEGKLGCNPNGLAHSDKLVRIK